MPPGRGVFVSRLRAQNPSRAWARLPSASVMSSAEQKLSVLSPVCHFQWVVCFASFKASLCSPRL